MGLLSPVIKWIAPLPVRQWIRRSHRRMTLAQATRRLRRRLKRGELIPDRLFQNLVYGWGNQAWSAQSGYLRAIVQAAQRTPGPILECGSGLSTLVLGLAAEATGKRVWSLEHSPEWAGRLRSELTALRVRGIELCDAPLRDYGLFAWYTPPVERLPLGFSMVVCDGPPGRTPGGRYGLLPVMRSRLAPGCMILLDDFVRPEEQSVVSQWGDEFGVRIARPDSGGTLAQPQRFVVLTLPES